MKRNILKRTIVGVVALNLVAAPLTQTGSNYGLPGMSLTARAAAWSGSGTSESPYLIGTKAELEALAAAVNAVNDGANQSGKYFKLTADIDLEGSESDQWTPIGIEVVTGYKEYNGVQYPITRQGMFSGTFDGDGHTISGLYINTEKGFPGLFGYVRNGTIKNLAVSGSVTHTGDANSNYAGGIAALTQYNSVIENCASAVTVTSAGSFVGGIVGCAEGTVSKCYNVGAITGRRFVGGITGQCNYVDVYEGEKHPSYVTDCYNTGTIKGTGTDEYDNGVGGVVGFNPFLYNSTDRYGVVQRCYNTGNVTGVSAGSVVGINDSYFKREYNDETASYEITARHYSIVEDCYFQTGTASNGIGGQMAEDGETMISSDTGAAPKTADELKTAAPFDTWSTDTWIFATDSYPKLKNTPEVQIPHDHSFTYAAGTGDNANTITAMCSDCTLTEAQRTITISAPTSLTYNGTGKAAVLSTGHDTTNAFPYVSDITYTKNGEPFTGTPTDAGTYVASVSVGASETDCSTASVSFTINACPLSLPTEANTTPIAISGLVYDGTAQQLINAPTTLPTIGMMKYAVMSKEAVVTAINRPEITMESSNTDIISAFNNYYYHLTAEQKAEFITSIGGLKTNVSDITGIGAGSYYVGYYVEAPNANYISSPLGILPVAIGAGTMSVTASDYSAAYDGSAHGITLTGVPESSIVSYCTTENGTYSTEPVTYTDFTNGAQTVYYKIENTNYTTVTGSATVNITKKNISNVDKPVAINALTYTGASQVLFSNPIGLPEGVEVQYKDFSNKSSLDMIKSAFASDDGWSSDIPEGTAVKAYTYGYRIKGNGNYSDYPAADAVTESNVDDFILVNQITKKQADTAKFTFIAPQSLVYNGFSKTASVISADSGIANEDITVYYSPNGSDWTTNAPVTVGTYKVAVDLTEGDYFYSASKITDNSWVFTIDKADITPSVSLEGWAYGESAKAPSVSGNTENGPVTYKYKLNGADDKTYSAEVPTAAGTYVVKADIAGTANYNAGTAEKEFTVAKKPLKITADKAGKVYGTADPALTYTLEGTLVGEDRITGSLTREKGDNTGEYTIGQGTLTAGDNYAIEFVSDKFTVTPAEFNISASGYSGAYDGKDHGIAASSDVEDAKVYYLVSEAEPEEAAFTEDALTESPKYKNAGTYKIWYCITAPNYSTVISYQTVEITKAAVAPTVSIANWTYGEKQGVPKIEGLPEGTDFSAKVTYYKKGTDKALGAEPTDAGEYTVAAVIGESANYLGGTAKADFSIAKAAITPSVTLAGWKNGETANNPVVTGNAGNGSVKFEYMAKDAEDGKFSETVPAAVGTYVVKASVAETANYKAGSATAEFTIGHGHSYSDKWSYDESKHWRECTSAEGECDAQKTDVAEHTFTEWKVTKEATCEEAGTESRKCTVCGKEETRPVAATGHKYGTPVYTWSADGKTCTATVICETDKKFTVTETVEVTSEIKTPATCDKAGVTAYSAKFENELFSAQTKEIENIPATGHKYGTPVYAWSEDGKTCTATVTCEHDKTHAVTETVEVTSAVKTPATCEKAGVTTYTAAFKNELFTSQTKDVEDIPATGHKFGEWTVTKEATCDEDGTESRKCELCEKEETKVILAEGHELGDWEVTKPATCEEKGIETRYCTHDDGTFETRDIPAIGHKYGTPVYTWSEDGKTCTATVTCEHDKTHVITEKAVITSAVKTAATCDKAGVTTYTATFKNELFSVQTKDVEDIPATGHKYGTPEYTWSADGKTCTATVTCETDKKFTVTEEAKITSAVKVAATCDKAGVTTYTATFKNELFSAQTKDVENIPAAGHKYGKPEYTWSADGKTCTATVTCENDKTHVITEKATVTGAVKTAATCDKAGVTTYTATFKNELFSAQTKEVEDIPATGEHKFGKWTINIVASADGDGEKQHVCDVCGKVEKEATKYDDEVKPTEPGTPEDEDAPGKIENITDPKENACGGTIEVSKNDILETFPLEKKELESVENGSDISLKLEVKDIAEEVKASEDADKINAAVEDAIEKLVVEMNADNSVTEEKKTEEIAKVKNAKVAAVLDVTIEKFIDGEDAGRVTELKKPLRVYINLPEGLYEEGRSYFVVREHNGEYEALELHIIDAARGWFESQYYSKFYIMYTEKAAEPVAEPEPVVEPVVEPELVVEPVVEPEPAVEPVVAPEPVHEHEFGEWKTSQNASWLHRGYEERTCECGEKETRRVEESWAEWLVGAVGRRLRNLFR